MDSQSQEVGSLVLKFVDISRVKGKMWNVYQKGKDLVALGLLLWSLMGSGAFCLLAVLPHLPR